MVHPAPPPHTARSVLPETPKHPRGEAPVRRFCPRLPSLGNQAECQFTGEVGYSPQWPGAFLKGPETNTMLAQSAT